LLLLLRLFLGAGTVSFLLDPLVTRLSAHMPRRRAAICAMLIAAACAALSLFLLFPPLARQFSDLVTAFPAIVEKLNSLVDALTSFLTERGFSRLNFSGFDWQKLSAPLSGLWSGTAKVFGSLAGGVSTFFLSCILAFYFLSEKPSALLQAEMLVPCRWRKPLARMAAAVRDELRSYLRGQALVCLCVGALSALLFALVGVQGSLALGLLVGLANCIPYFGPFIGGIPAVIMALSASWQKAIFTVAALFLVQQIDGLVLSPRIMGSITGFSPAVVLLAIFLGQQSFGIWGMLLAMPLMMSFRTVYRVFVQRHENN